MSAPAKSILKKFRRSLLYLAVVFTICVGGYHIYGWNMVDSIYMVVITMFGVGYGEVHPLDATGKIFTIFVIVGGTSAVVFVIGEVIRFITEGEIMKAIGELKKSKQVEVISDHAIICGYGRIGQILAHELNAAKFPFVVVDLDDARLAMAEESGYLYVKGSATEEETLQRAHVERAIVLATVLPQDTLNVFITLKGGNGGRIDALRELNRDHVSLIGVDVAGAYLQGVQLAGAEARRATFAESDLRDADFRRADLPNADLHFANMRRASFRDSNLAGARLDDADLVGADLAGANLDGVTLDRADLRDASLYGVKNWQAIKSMSQANILGISNAPAGFIEWAKKRGAVELKTD